MKSNFYILDYQLIKNEPVKVFETLDTRKKCMYNCQSVVEKMYTHMLDADFNNCSSIV